MERRTRCRGRRGFKRGGDSAASVDALRAKRPQRSRSEPDAEARPGIRHGVCHSGSRPLNPMASRPTGSAQCQRDSMECPRQDSSTNGNRNVRRRRIKNEPEICRVAADGATLGCAAQAPPRPANVQSRSGRVVAETSSASRKGLARGPLRDHSQRDRCRRRRSSRKLPNVLSRVNERSSYRLEATETARPQATARLQASCVSHAVSTASRRRSGSGSRRVIRPVPSGSSRRPAGRGGSRALPSRSNSSRWLTWSNG